MHGAPRTVDHQIECCTVRDGDAEAGSSGSLRAPHRGVPGAVFVPYTGIASATTGFESIGDYVRRGVMTTEKDLDTEMPEGFEDCVRTEQDLSRNDPLLRAVTGSIIRPGTSCTGALHDRYVCARSICAHATVFPDRRCAQAIPVRHSATKDHDSQSRCCFLSARRFSAP